MKLQTTFLKRLQRQPYCFWLICIGITAGLSTLVTVLVLQTNTEPIRLPELVTEEQYKTASNRFRALYERKPNRFDLLSMIGELCVREEQLETAVACFAEIPNQNREYGLSARLQEGQILLKLNRAEAAEHSLRQFLKMAKNQTVAREQLITAYKWLAYLLSVELRFEDRKPILTELETLKLADVSDSKQIYFPNLLIWNSTSGRHRLAEFVRVAPDNLQLLLAHARYLTVEGKLEEAQMLLEQLGQRDSQNLMIVAARIECLFEQSDWPSLIELAKSLPPCTSSEPWHLTRMRGEIALHQGEWENSIMFFRQLLESDPANPWCRMGLARAFSELNRIKELEQCQRESLILANIRASLGAVREDSPEMIRRTMILCQELKFESAAGAFLQHSMRIEKMKNRGISTPATNH